MGLMPTVMQRLSVESTADSYKSFRFQRRRHTSFCSVDVIAEIEDDDIDMDIPEDDLRIDTYRSSGKGGQHVNKTDSAVRLTHLPTNIVVQCQNQRSQQNKQTAMKVLKSRIYEKQQDEKRAEMEKFYGEKGEMGWGNQIRSYVFQPYQMVKDLRTGVETSGVQAVMDGELDPFVNGWLRAGCPRQRNKDIQVDDLVFAMSLGLTAEQVEQTSQNSLFSDKSWRWSPDPWVLPSELCQWIDDLCR